MQREEAEKARAFTEVSQSVLVRWKGGTVGFAETGLASSERFGRERARLEALRAEPGAARPTEPTGPSESRPLDSERPTREREEYASRRPPRIACTAGSNTPSSSFPSQSPRVRAAAALRQPLGRWNRSPSPRRST